MSKHAAGSARLFIAVWPPEDVVSALTSLHRKDQSGVRFVHPENWHITLRFLGETNIAEAIDALEGIALEPAHAVLGPAVDVIDQRALVVPVAGLDDIAAEVNRRTREIGAEPPRKRFVGHLTLARVKPRVPMPRTLGEMFHASFDVAEIALVQSRLGSGAARYETIASWPVG